MAIDKLNDLSMAISDNIMEVKATWQVIIQDLKEAREALDRFKMEVASEIGVPLKQGYNGDLTSAQTGSIGGEMVRQMIKRQEEQMKSNGTI